MALVKREMTTLNGSSEITVDGNKITAMQFTAVIENGVITSKNSYLHNQEVYNANLETCRADEDEFETWCRELEDESKNKYLTLI